MLSTDAVLQKSCWELPPSVEYRPCSGRTARHGGTLVESVDNLPDDLREYATHWMWAYNHERPNMALSGLTPKQKSALLTDSASERCQRWGDYRRGGPADLTAERKLVERSNLWVQWPVRKWLVLLVLACLLPGVVGAVVMFFIQYRDGRARVERDAILMARAMVQAVRQSTDQC